jgi:hypothetical protein
MLRIIVASLVFLATAAPAFASPCNGGNLAVRSVAVKNVTTVGNLNRYEIAGTVTNVGSASEPSNTLQSVDIYQGADKLDSKSIPPLQTGQSYVFSYVYMRSTDAGHGTTPLSFKPDVRHASSASATCSPASHGATLWF